MDTYRAEFARIGHETATAAADAGGRGIAERLRGVPYSLRIYLGAPIIIAAAAGAARLMATTRGDRLTLALGGWSLSCLAFLALGVLTPVDMRYFLASIPAAAVAAAGGTAWAWTAGAAQGAAWRVAAVVLLGAAVSTGFHFWWNALG
jgi:hypothetical protein